MTPRSTPTERPGAPEPLGRILLATVVVVTAASIVLLVAPGLQFVVVAPGLDLVLNTATTLVAGAVAGLGWIRFQERRRPGDLLEAGAFLALFASGAVSISVPILGLDRALGMSLQAPGQAPLYIWGLGRLVVAVTLVAAASAHRERLVASARASIVGLLPLVVFVVLAALVVGAGSRLPDLIGPQGLARLQSNPVVPSELPGVTLLGAGLQLAGAALFILAATLNVRRYREDGRLGRAYLALGLILAAFSQLHSAIYPGTYASLVTSADLLRLAFYATLLVGVQAEMRADLRALRQANRELETLREGEALRAALEERARLAREIHDGLAQDLWLAKLRLERLARLPGLEGEAAGLVAEVTTAVERGLADARQAVIAMRADVVGGSLADLLGRYVEEFGDSSGLRVEFSAEPTLPPISPRRQAELLRIAQEALNNVRKHADATVVRVQAGAIDGRLRLSIVDNGRGFEPEREVERAGEGGFGLRSMRERAAAIGGQFRVSSRPRDGTVVVVELPFDPPVDAPVDAPLDAPLGPPVDLAGRG